MDGKSWTWIIVAAAPVFVVHLTMIALSKALQSYSRSRLEELTESRGRPERADEIDRLDVRIGRAAEAVSFGTGMIAAIAAGLVLDRQETLLDDVVLVLAIAWIGSAGYLAAGAVGRLYAESILDRLWPWTSWLRLVATPITAATNSLEWLLGWAFGTDEIDSRPASVEVEVPTDLEDDEDQEPELPDQARNLIGKVVELNRTAVSEIMQPRSAMVVLSDAASAEEAAAAFRTSGRSRIPLYGRNRDDVVGVLLVRDLYDRLLAAAPGESVLPAEIAREAYCVPETKNALELLEEMRFRGVSMALILDEYGGVAGLITIEDLVEELVGPIRDEYDAPTEDEPVVSLGDSAFEVDAGVELETLNKRFRLHLPTEEEYQTVGGLALHALGRLPEAGASFRRDGVEFTVLDVGARSIRRIKLDLKPEPEAHS